MKAGSSLQAKSEKSSSKVESARTLITMDGLIMFKEQEKIYNKAVELVCEECGITADDLRCGRNRIAADARFILVRLIAPYICDNAIAPQTTIVGAANIKCCNRAYGVSLSTPITINATYPA